MALGNPTGVASSLRGIYTGTGRSRHPTESPRYQVRLARSCRIDAETESAWLASQPKPDDYFPAVPRNMSTIG